MTILFFTILGDESGAFWTMAGVLLLLVSFIFVIRQIRIQNHSNMMSFIQTSESSWRSKDFLEIRKIVCENTDKSIDYNKECILSFFEDLGILYKRKVIDLDLIWDKFSYYIESYWMIIEPSIKEYQAKSKDKTWYENFEKLSHDILSLSKKKTGNKNYEISEKELDKFRKSEKKLIACRK